MLAKRRPPKMRIDAPQPAHPRHRKFVRGHVCIVPGCVDGPIECCHVRKGLPPDTPPWARGGTAMKPHDAFTFPACAAHHREQHRIGEASFAARYGVNALKEALDLARHSPVDDVRDFAKQIWRAGR